ncbi:hypothetical protein ACVWWH_000785 [Sinomonas sp. RB5]
MSRTNRLAAKFTDSFPNELVPGVLYISILFTTAAHLCCCGCGYQVFTPLRPNRWSMTYDGESISLSPSVGSAGLPCRSHYVIKRGQPVWCNDLTPDQIAQGMLRDGWKGPDTPVGWRRLLRPLPTRRGRGR